MPTIEEIRTAIGNAATGQRVVVVAQTFLQRWPSASQPVLVSGDDGRTYVVKGSQNRKMIVAEHVVGRLGQLLGAPVGEVAFASIPNELKAIEPNVQHIGGGIAHATLWIPGCTEREGLTHVAHPYNHRRFALLAALYSWAVAGDHQCIYSKGEPYEVYSVDHGHFFPGGPNWTLDSLNQAPLVQLDPWFAQCNLPGAMMAEARHQLESITDDDVNLIVSGPPDEWEFSEAERDALRVYLRRRRQELIALLAAN